MDKNYYYQKLAQERQRDLSRELATRTLLKDGKRDPLTVHQAKRLVLRIAPVVIFLTILLLYLLG